MRLLVLLAPLFVLGCGSRSGSFQIGGGPTPPSDRASAGGVGYTLPATVELTPIKVKAFDAEVKSKYAGKVVAADVWFLGCTPCKEKMPETVALAKEYAPKGAVVVTLDLMPDDISQKADVVKFLESVGATMPNYVFDDTEDATFAWQERAGFRPTPAVVFYDKTGEFVKSLVAPKKAEVAAELDRLLAK